MKMKEDRCGYRDIYRKASGVKSLLYKTLTS